MHQVDADMRVGGQRHRKGERPADGEAIAAQFVDAYRAANIEFNPALLSLRFAVEQRGSRQFVKITSTQPVNEPFVDMLLELSWSSGKLVREYTFLLDPVNLRNSQSQVVPPVVLPPASTARRGIWSVAFQRPR